MDDNSQSESAIRATSAVNFILGLWLIISPYILHYTTSQARWNQTVLGIIVALLALWRFMDVSAYWASWANAVAGLWLIMAPFILSYEKRVAYWNEIVTAVILVILAISNANMHIERRTHHHAT